MRDIYQWLKDLFTITKLKNSIDELKERDPLEIPGSASVNLFEKFFKKTIWLKLTG
jgi:hypothetical protein